MTILTNCHKKGFWILNKSHFSSDANKPYEDVKKWQLSQKNKTKDEKFDARCELKSINLYLGVRKKYQSQVSKQCQLLQSYVVASRLLGGETTANPRELSYLR